MTHFLAKKNLLVKVMPRHAGVRIEHGSLKGQAKVLVVTPQEGVPVFLVQKDTLFTPLTPGYEVRSTEGEVMRPTGVFVVSAETIDPFHILLDVDEEVWATAPYATQR